MGGRSDWEIQFNVSCDNAGRVESCSHRALRVYFRQTSFEARSEISRETFCCPVEKAVEVVKSFVAKSVRVSIEQEEILWTEIQLTTIKAEIKEFKELLIFIHNPYRNDFNLLYGLYLAKIGVIPVPQGDFQYNLTDNQLDGLAQAACLPKDFLRAWPKSPKQKNGTLAKWLC